VKGLGTKKLPIWIYSLYCLKPK